MPACTPVCVAQTCKLVGPLCAPAVNGERWPLESQSHNDDATMLHPMSLHGSRSGRPRDRVTILILIQQERCQRWRALAVRPQPAPVMVGSVAAATQRRRRVCAHRSSIARQLVNSHQSQRAGRPRHFQRPCRNQRCVPAGGSCRTQCSCGPRRWTWPYSSYCSRCF
jgi:hypothetical protein